MLIQTFTSQPYEYRLPGAIPVFFFPFTHLNDYLITPPRIYGEAYTPGGDSVILINPEALASGYQTIWLGLNQDEVHYPGSNFVFYRFNGTTGEWIGRVDLTGGVALVAWMFAQARDGTVFALRTNTDEVYQVTVDPTAVTISPDVSFDVAGLLGTAPAIQAFNIDTALNLLMIGQGFFPRLYLYNLTTGALLNTIATAGWPTSIMPVDQRLVYVMTNTGIMHLVDFQAGKVLSTFMVQAAFYAGGFALSSTITYDAMYRRFISWIHEPEDGTGQNTSILRGYYPVPQATAITKSIPLRPPRKYRSVPILNRVYGDVGESVGGGIVTLTSLDATLGTIQSFPAITDGEGESVGTLLGVDSGSPTIVATVNLDSPNVPPPPPPPFASNVRQPGDFPRLGGYLPAATSSLDDPTFQAQIAKLDVAVVAFPPDYLGVNGHSAAQVTMAIKSINPHIVLVNYTDPVQHPPAYNASAYSLAGDMLTDPAHTNISDPQKRPQWYLFDHSYTPKNLAAAHIASPWGPGDLVNFLSYNGSNLNIFGQTPNQWRAQYDAAYSTGSALSLDGIYIDHSVFDIASLIGPAPSGDFDSPGQNVGTIIGDWNRDENAPYPPATHYGHSPPSPANTADRSTTTNTAFQNGIADLASKLRANMGAGKFVFANLKDWNHGLLGPLFNIANGGVIESMIGQSESYETTSFDAMFTAFKNIMVAIANPKLAIFAHDGDPTDYQDVRYGLCSCLMGTNGFGDAYYYHSDSASRNGYANVNWFDEFDFNLGAAIQLGGFLWQNGVYRRDFQHGIALVNPKGNGTQTVTLEKTFTKLTGTQDPTVNDGSTVTSVVLQDRDGIILNGGT